MIENSRDPNPPGSHPAPAPPRNPRIALAHDWLSGFRGGEAVLERIAAVISPAAEISALYCMFDDGSPLAPTIDRLRARGRIIAAPINRLPGASGRFRRWLLPFYPDAVARLSRILRKGHADEPIDLLISSSSAAIKGLHPPAGIPHLCYCHTPPRYIWSQLDQYGGRGPIARLRCAGLSAYRRRFQDWDRATAAHVTAFLANSSHTAALIRSAYGRDADVIHPPVRTEFFTPDAATPRGDHWLVVSALEPYKRVDLAIRAAKLAGKPLVVAGRGSQLATLEALARSLGADVQFRGRISDDDLRTLYRTAGLFLFPQVEDFGITAVEAQACGLTVVARRAGGALDSVIEGRTGAFFDAPTPEALAAAAAGAPRDPDACRRNAERFSEARFDRAMLAAVESCLASG